MKKILIIIFLCLANSIFSQKLIESKDGYSEVVEVELKKEVIRQKIKEWITLNYKSAKDVIQLDTESKIITKGNFVFQYQSGETVVDYRISNTMIFSIRDNKFKLELTPTSIKSKEFPSLVIEKGIYELLMTDVVLSETDYLTLAKRITLKQFKALGYKDKKAQKMLEKANQYIIENYNNYQINHKNFNKGIKDTFTSIKNKVTKKEDW